MVNEESIDRVQCLMPGFFKRSGTPTFTKWPGMHRFAQPVCLANIWRLRVNIGIRVGLCRRSFKEPVRKHEHLSASCSENFKGFRKRFTMRYFLGAGNPSMKGTVDDWNEEINLPIFRIPNFCADEGTWW